MPIWHVMINTGEVDELVEMFNVEKHSLPSLPEFTILFGDFACSIVFTMSGNISKLFNQI